MRLQTQKRKARFSTFQLPLEFLPQAIKFQLKRAKDIIFLGELSLDGGVRHVNGVLPILISARKEGHKKFVIPFENTKEASFIDGIEVYPVKNLKEVVKFLQGEIQIKPVETTNYENFLVHIARRSTLSLLRGKQAQNAPLKLPLRAGITF